MDNQTFIQKYNELLDNSDLDNFIKQGGIELANSGGIDLESFDDNYEAPKIILKAVLINFANQITLPNERENNKIVNNLLHF